MNFDDFYSEWRIAELPDEMTCDIPGGFLLKKTVLKPTEAGRLDIFLTTPGQHGGHLYLFVKTRGGAQFGWCRWHRLAMTILAEESPATAAS